MNLSNFLLTKTNRKRAVEQRRARTLLFEGIESSFNQKEQQFPQIKNFLADIKLAFIIRSGYVEDLRRFVIWAGENRCNYLDWAVSNMGMLNSIDFYHKVLILVL